MNLNYTVAYKTKKIMVMQFKLYLCTVVLRINKIQSYGATQMTKLERHFFPL
jgi:hypothetical protein